MTGWTAAPNNVTFSRRLSLGAKVVHTALLHLAWVSGGRPENGAVDEPVELPALPEIAEMVGCSRTALRGYVAELESEGLVERQRASKRRPSLYRILTVSKADSVSVTGLQSVPLGPPDGSDSGSLERGPLIGPKTSTTNQDIPTPPLVLLSVNGHGRKQNVALNALLRVTGIHDKSPRVGEAIVALNGKAKSGDPDARVGIRDLFWIEACEWAEQHGDEGAGWLAGVAAGGDRFELALAAVVDRKAELYRQRMAHMMLTPGALRRYWLDLEVAQPQAGLSADEIERLGDG